MTRRWWDQGGLDLCLGEGRTVEWTLEAGMEASAERKTDVLDTEGGG